MQKFLTVSIMILLVGLLFQTGHAQITISTSGDMYPTGSNVTTWQIDSIDADIYDMLAGTTGGNQIWDLSARDFVQESEGFVVDKSGAPLADSFPDANFVVLNYEPQTMADSIWSFTDWMPLAVATLGNVAHSGGTEFITKFQSTTPDYVFPINYNSQWVATHSRIQSFAADTYNEYIDSNYYDVDGWGTMIYGGNSTPCLRFSYTHRSVTNTYVSGIPISSTTSEDEGVEFFDADFSYLLTATKLSSLGSDTYSAYGGNVFVTGPTGVRENHPGMVPTGYELTQNYPNPFNPTTEIQFNLPRSSAVKLSIYNMLGQEIKTLIDRPMDAGMYTVDWNGTSDDGRSVASGIYFYRLRAGDFTESRKMVLVK